MDFGGILPKFIFTRLATGAASYLLEIKKQILHQQNLADRATPIVSTTRVKKVEDQNAENISVREVSTFNTAAIFDVFAALWDICSAKRSCIEAASNADVYTKIHVVELEWPLDSFKQKQVDQGVFKILRITVEDKDADDEVLDVCFSWSLSRKKEGRIIISIASLQTRVCGLLHCL